MGARFHFAGAVVRVAGTVEGAGQPGVREDGTFASVSVRVKQIRDYINSWNENPRPFIWTATADEILAKVRLVQTSVEETRQ